MRKAVLIFLLALFAVPAAVGAERVSVERLQHLVLALRGKSDMKAAERLYRLELTQRLSEKTFAALKAELPGADSRLALTMLAEQAVFLPLPKSELPDKAAPTLMEQQAIFEKSVDYELATLHRMPNLFARMDTIRYENTPVAERTPSGLLVPEQPIHPVSRTVETVWYRDGKEIVTKQAGADGKGSFGPVTMLTYGEFGPIFSVIYGDLPGGKLQWSHWVLGEHGVDAVFRFSVPKRASHYMVGFCCVGGHPYKGFTAYEGELRIDPASGTILRVTVVAQLSHSLLTREGIMVRYRPVMLGGKQYYCPAKSIAIYRSPEHGALSMNSPDDAPIPGAADSSGDLVPMQTRMNTIVFDHYHLFRAKVKILPYSKKFAAKQP